MRYLRHTQIFSTMAELFTFIATKAQIHQDHDSVDKYEIRQHAINI